MVQIHLGRRSTIHLQPRAFEMAHTDQNYDSRNLTIDPALLENMEAQKEPATAPSEAMKIDAEPEEHNALFAAEQKAALLLEKIRATRARVAFARQVGQRTFHAIDQHKAQQLVVYLVERANAINEAAAELEARLDAVIAEVNR